MSIATDRGNRLLALGTSTLFGLIAFYMLNSWGPIVIMTISLTIQEILSNTIFFREQSRAFSRRLGSNDTMVLVKSKIGRIPTTALIFVFPFIISAAIFGMISLIVQHSTFSFLTGSSMGLIISVVLLGLLIDPVVYVFFEMPFWDTWAIIFGYLSILLVAIGSVSEKSGEPIFLIFLLVALLNVRQTFTIQFNYNENTDIRFLAPSMFALFIAMLPNLLVVLEIIQLGGQ